MNYERARSQDVVRVRGGDRFSPNGRGTESKPRKGGGPTGPQQKYIAALCRQLGRPYERVATRQEASALIDALKLAVEKQAS